MLYVFLVDTGKMVTFDMNHAVESVEHLKVVIHQRFNVPPEKQVLLISGGESLQPTASVGSYSAGTDTNPIYFFNKVSIESDALDRSNELVTSDQDVEVEAVMNLPPAYDTVVVRTQLAQEFCDRARQELRISESLVHEQHLQQQGWAAVVANLDDMTRSLKNNAAGIEQELTEFLSSHQQHMELLESLEEDIVLLGKIPVLPALLSAEQHDEQKGMMLLDWINSTDSKSSLKEMASQCKQCLKQLIAEGQEKCRTEVQKVMELVDNQDMLQIRGVEEWLTNLDELLDRARKLVQNQQDYLQAFLHNQSSFSRSRDSSVLPDLCESHVKQLRIMLQHHEDLRDIRRRCVSAKNKLCDNLKERLRWIIYVQKIISEAQVRMMYTIVATRQLRKQLEICRQIHMAPHTYLRAVTEVIRRRHFSHNFLQWAGMLSSQCQQLHLLEVQARKDFNSQFSKHFLHALFPGMDDLPPPFATRNPKSFDDNLPLLSAEDLEVLRKALPEMSELLQTPDTVQLPTVVLQSSDAMQSCGDDASQPEVKASSSCSPRHASCQELPPEEAKYQTEEAMKSTSSEKDCHDGACPEDRECTPKLAVSDDEFEEVADEPSPGLKADAADILGMPVPQDAILCSPDSLGHTSHDFQTADFYIDESMPSSISDSNGIVPVAPSAVPPSSAVPAQQAHVAAELQRQLDERSTALLAAQEELERERVKRQELRCAVTNVCETAAAVCADSRSTADSIRKDLAAALQMVSTDASAIGAAMDTALQALLARLENEKAASIAAEVDRVRREFESAEEDHRHQLEVERHNFEGAKREVHTYQQQVQHLMQLNDTLNADSALALASLKNTMQQEHESAIAKATLEHELEQEALNERLRAFERSHEEEVQDLNDMICEKDRQIQMLFQDRQVLEEQLHARFSLEKEELLAQCSQECAQREQAIREELVALHEQQLNQIQHCHEEAIQKAKEQTRLELQQEWESRMPDFKLLQRRESMEDLDTAAGDSCSLEEAKPDPCGDSMMESTVKLPHSADPMLLELRSQLLEKQNEVNRLQQQVMAMSDNFGTQLQPSPVDKVSILTCQPGDIVLLCYDEGHQNYVLFVLGPNLHFLHTDCLDTLGLKTAPGTVRKGWVLAEVVEKEFCQARKPQNRYRVPAGTRFYRVKAKPWDKEAAVRREQQRRSSLRSLTQSSLITATSAAAVEEGALPPPPGPPEGSSAGGEPYPQPLDS
uniref:RB1-inducible coiled-coil protein 1 n=1 Tax=Rhipicephalus zambeziensis TaxID=60191 RepID=A0A224Z7I7_9ACAR